LNHLHGECGKDARMLRQRFGKARTTFDIPSDLVDHLAQSGMTRALLNLVQGFEQRDAHFNEQHELPPEVRHHPQWHLSPETGSKPCTSTLR
jgi:hypothetical protein